MRQRRIKVAAEEAPAVYHCMSRSVNGERLIDDQAKEVLRKQLWQVADYCGVQVITYAILSNHFHILVNVPLKVTVPDAELLRRYQILHPNPTRYQVARLEVIKTKLLAGGPEADDWRRRQLAQMGDLSQFMKLLKQRFATWFNKTHGRFGPFWCERFKSNLAESRSHVILILAGYIDLNCVRAGLVRDPMDYRFCGYSEAVAGQSQAQQGVRFHREGATWDEAHADYRPFLLGTGHTTHNVKGAISTATLQHSLNTGGTLPLSTVLRCRLRFLHDGAVLGSKAFVNSHLPTCRHAASPRIRTKPRPFPAVAEWGDLATLRPQRKRANEIPVLSAS